MTALYHAHAIQLPLFVTSKICPRCIPPTDKPLEEFYKNRHSKDGLTTYCKECVLKDSKKYQSSHRDHCKATRAEYCRTHRKQQNAYSANYGAAHREQLHETSHRYDLVHRDRRLAYASAHAEERRAYGSKWAKENRLRLRERDMKRNARKRDATVDKVSYARILERDGYFCYICEKDIDSTMISGAGKLTFDHVLPLAGKEYRKGMHTEDNIKPVHRVCNLRKGTRLLEEMTQFQRRGID